MMADENNLTQQRINEDYRRTFLATKHGRRVLDDLMLFTGVLAECPTAKDEGRRLVGLQILARLDKRSLKGLLELEQEYGLELTQIGEED